MTQLIQLNREDFNFDIAMPTITRLAAIIPEVNGNLRYPRIYTYMH